MKLIEKGILSLDDKIVDHLPENITAHLLSDPSTAPVVQTITLKHLMSHTSGISQGGFPGYPDPTKIPTASDIITGGPLVNTMPIKLITLPGLEFMYSGGGCTLLQLIMERATNTPFVDIITKYVLKPLNMTRSYYSLPLDEENIASVYYNGTLRNETPWHTLPEQAAAGLWTTPADLLKLVRAIQDSLDPPPSQFTSPFMPKSLARTMLTLVKQYMCLLWFANDTQFGHSGGNAPGYCCYLYGYASLPWNTSSLPTLKDKGLVENIPNRAGISIMTNSGLGGRTYAKLLQAICFLKGWPAHDEMGGLTGIGTPYPALAGPPVPSYWREWMGTHRSDVWRLVEYPDTGLPAVRLTDSGLVLRLVPAATPSKEYKNGRRSIELLFEGLRLMIRLCWDGDEMIVEFVNDGKETRTVLRGSKEGEKQLSE